jgi:hypothetical protein
MSLTPACRAWRLQFINHDLPSYIIDVVLLPPLSKKNLGRETLSPALFRDRAFKAS